MASDSKWEVTSDPFSLASLIAWLEQQPAGAAYDYTDPRNCMLCQYFTAMGFKNVGVNPVAMHCNNKSAYHELPKGWNEVAHAETFGEALKRARALSR